MALRAVFGPKRNGVAKKLRKLLGAKAQKKGRDWSQPTAAVV